MHYLIDGYNWIFRILRAGNDLIEQRTKMVRELNEKAQYLDLNMTIVFDAHHQGGELHKSHFKHVEIVFTAAGETADDYILHYLKHCRLPDECTVVTSDKKLAWQARRRSAKTEEISPFLQWLDKRYVNKKRRIKKPSPAPHVPKALPPKKEAQKGPGIDVMPEDCFDYYLQEFEKSLQAVESKEKIKKPSTPKYKSRKKKFKPKEQPELSSAEDDFNRWLTAFTE